MPDDVYICPKCNERMQFRGGIGIEEFYCSADRLTAEFSDKNKFMLSNENYSMIVEDTFDKCCDVYKKHGFSSPVFNRFER